MSWYWRPSERAQTKKRRSPKSSPLAKTVGLESLNVFGLQSLGAFRDGELDRLTLLQALEATGLDGREMHENVFASLTADKAVALGVIEPFYCSLFHSDWVLFLCVVTLEGFGRKLGRD